MVYVTCCKCSTANSNIIELSFNLGLVRFPRLFGFPASLAGLRASQGIRVGGAILLFCKQIGLAPGNTHWTLYYPLIVSGDRRFAVKTCCSTHFLWRVFLSLCFAGPLVDSVWLGRSTLLTWKHRPERSDDIWWTCHPQCQDPFSSCCISFRGCLSTSPSLSPPLREFNPFPLDSHLPALSGADV